jgi:hypothetical protein
VESFRQLLWPKLGEIVVADSELDLDELAALFRGEPNHISRRYTLEMIDGQLVFRRWHICAAFDAYLDELEGKASDPDDYMAIVVTGSGPKRMKAFDA